MNMWCLIIGYFLISACAGESSRADTLGRSRRQHPQAYPQQQQQRQQHQQYQQPPIQYRPLGEAPEGIRQILQLQQTPEPLVVIPAPHPPPQLQPAPVHQQQQEPQPQQRPQQLYPAQYNTAVKQLYGGPQQPIYKGIQAAPQRPLGQQYTPQYRTNYGPQQQQLQQPSSPNSLYRSNLVAGPPAPSLGPYHPQLQQQQQQPISQQQFPKNLPPHIQNIIQSQRSYQG